MNREQFEKLIEACERVDLEPYAYSGRAMYGRKCLAVDCRNPIEGALSLARGIADQSEDIDEARDLLDALDDATFDSMGRDYVVYFPNITWIDLED